MTIFFARPKLARMQPYETSSAPGGRQRTNSERNKPARTIGPASNCGKNAKYIAYRPSLRSAGIFLRYTSTKYEMLWNV